MQISWHLVRLVAVCVTITTLTQQAEAAKPAVNGKVDVTKYSTEPFDTQRNTLSAIDLNGHNAAAVMAALRRAPVKDQYETSAAFEERLAVWKTKPLYGNVTADSTITISTLWTPYFSKFYDADSAQMNFLFDSDYDDADGYPFIPFKSIHKKMTPGHGQTGMGVKFSWTREYQLALGTRLGGASGKSMALTIQPDEARKVVPVLLFVGKIDSFDTFEAKTNHEPTLSERWESAYWTAGWTLGVEQVWVVDGVRRTILAKLCKGPHRFEKCAVTQQEQ